MAWQNLGEELAAEFADARPTYDPNGLTFRQRGNHTYDSNDQRWKRRMLAEARARYTEADRNRTYTVRKAVRAYQRGAVCANDETGRFVKRTA